MNNPMISIIVPVYNVEHYLNKCLNSIEKQSYQDYELIIVDDGSTDNSSAICDTFAKSHPNAVVIHQTNGGLSVARNVGIKSAKGEYLIFVDSDDFLIGEEALSRIAVLLEHLHPELLICLPDEYDEDGTTVIYHHNPGKWDENKIYHGDKMVDGLYELNGIWVTLAQTKIIKRDYCSENHLFFYEGIYHEDDEWIARVILSRPTTAFHYQPWYGYRHRENSIVSSADSQKRYKRTCDKIKAASSMLNQTDAHKYKYFIRYVSDYLFNTIISANQFDVSYTHEFISFLQDYKRLYKRVLPSKSVKLILKALFIMTFGEKRFIDIYKGKNNAES